MMTQIFRVALLLAVAILTACGAAPAEPVAIATQVVEEPTPSATAVVPTATAEPSATSAPTATLVPTGTPPATATATASPEATATGAPTETAVPPTPTSAPIQAGGTTPEGIAVRPELDGTIAFVREGDIYGYQPQTGAVDLLIENGRDMQFSPDGTQITFVRDDGLYLAAADGSGERRIADLADIRMPVWSDDGSKIAFARGENVYLTGDHEIWSIEVPGGEPVRIAQGTDPAWAPDSKRIAYVTPATGGLRRNQLRLTNWRGENDWPVIREIPANTPPLGIPGGQVPPSGLEHVLFSPVWDAAGRSIYVPAFMIMQVETDFTILERADADAGGSVMVAEIQPGVFEALASPNREAVLFVSGSARGDMQLTARPIDPSVSTGQYSWAATREVALNEAPAWAPAGDAIAYIRCSLEDPTECALALRRPGLEQPDILIPDLFEGQAPNRAAGLDLAWGR